MKRILMIAVFTLSFLPAEIAYAATFADANQKYQQGDFKAAADIYEELAKSPNASGAVYFNLGNARFRLGQTGRAVLSYERALRLLPRDKDLRWNLSVVRSVLKDRLETTDDNVVWAWLKQGAYFFTLDELAAAVAACLFLIFVMTLLSLFFPQLKLLPQTVQGFLFIGLVALTALFWAKWYQHKDPRVVILDKRVEAHYGPSNKEIHEGAEAKLLDESRGWVYVTLNNKNSGWIARTSCEVI
jgi:tetratricopeptide (TPR) repeat protein